MRFTWAYFLTALAALVGGLLAVSFCTANLVYGRVPPPPPPPPTPAATPVPVPVPVSVPVSVPVPVPVPVPVAVPSPVPAPTPSLPPTPALPLPATGLLFTFDADSYATVNAACLPTNATVDVAYCQTIRNATDLACIRAACTAYVSNEITDNVYFAGLTFYYTAPIDVGRWTTGALLNPTPDDLGPVPLVYLIQKFMADNPVTVPQPLVAADNASVLFLTPAEYASGSFAVSSGDLGRQVLLAAQNELMNRKLCANETDVIFTLNRLVVTSRTPRCNDSALAAIPWMDETTRFFDIYANLVWISGLNTSAPQADPANWPAECLYWTSYPTFCDLFPDYYSFESLRNYSIVPSPWRDYTTVLAAFNREYLNGAPPIGCFGLAPV